MPTLQFKGKNIIWNHHLSVPYHTLEEDQKLGFQAKKGDGNLIIEGDNLLALKALLPQYTGKVKCIYIDPPYNTGNEGWVYNDKVNSPLIKEWLGKEVGKDDMTRHDKWLCMMVPRLKLLRELLASDGAIFISIDENEIINLTQISTEIFGEENIVSCLSIVNNLKGRNDKKNIATCHEYLLILQKNDWNSLGLPLTEEQLKEYKYKDKDGKRYALRDLRKRGRPDRREDRPNMFFPIYCNPKTLECSLNKNKNYIQIIPKRGDGTDGRWRWGKERVEKFLSWLHPRYSEGKDKWDIDHRVYLDLMSDNEINDEESDDDDFNYVRTSKSKSFWMESAISSDVALRELKEIFNSTPFDYPKAPSLIKKILQISSKDNDLILDSFAGSGTTMQAVADLNKEDGGNRQCILVQMNEATEAEPKKNICRDITRERVKRAIEKYGYDSGFKYLRVGDPIDSENMLSGVLPTYKQFAKYAYYLCTGEYLADESVINEKTYFVGTFKKSAIYLVYKQDYDTLIKLALNLPLAEGILKDHPGHKLIIYAPACFLDEEYLQANNIEYVGIPYNLFRRQA
jgi:DNA modification methylase